MKLSRWRALAISVCTALAGSLLVVAPAEGAEDAHDVTINLVVTNDFHGHVDENLVQWAATVQQLLADEPASNSLMLGAGDMVGNSLPASAAQQDSPTIDVLNLLGLDASAVGNHEFDWGYDNLVGRIMKRADFPILGANVAKADGSAALDASTMFIVGDVRLAVVGAVTDTTPQLLPPLSIAGLTFSDPVAAINGEVTRLKGLPAAEQPDVIVAAIHDGAPWGTWELNQAKSRSRLFSRLIDDTSPEVDAIVTGHTHNTYVFNAPIRGETGRTRPVIQTGSGGDNVGQIKLTVDGATGAVTAATARNVARVSTPDAELVASDPTLAEIADLRDAAVEFAATRKAYEAGRVKADQAYAAVVSAKAAHEAGVVAAQEAHDTAVSLKERFDAAVAAGTRAYATAADLQQQHLVATAEGKNAYARTADLEQRHAAAVAKGKASSARAAKLKRKHHTAIMAGKKAGTRAATLKKQHKKLAASGKSRRLATLAKKHRAAVAARRAAYARARAVAPAYRTAAATAKRDNAKARSLLSDYRSALAVAERTDVATQSLISQYQAAIAAAESANARAAAIKDEYDATMSTWRTLLATAEKLKSALDAAVETLNAALKTVATLKDILLGLL